MSDLLLLPLELQIIKVCQSYLLGVTILVIV